MWDMFKIPRVENVLCVTISYNLLQFLTTNLQFRGHVTKIVIYKPFTYNTRVENWLSFASSLNVREKSKNKSKFVSLHTVTLKRT